MLQLTKDAGGLALFHAKMYITASQLQMLLGWDKENWKNHIYEGYC